MTMTNSIKNVTIVFAFAAMLMAWPLVGTNAFADGEGIISGTCGFTEPSSIDFGTISRGTVGTETGDSWAALGSETGNIDLDAGDWFDLGDRGVGDLDHDGTDITTTATVVIGTETFTATSGGSGAFNFDYDGNAAADFAALQAAISTDSVFVTAVLTSSTLIDLTAVARGTAGNLALSTTGTTGITDTDLTGGGDNPVVHLQAEVTKLYFTVDGTDPLTVQNYAGKTAIGASGVDTEIVTLTSPNFPLRTAFQITGVDPALENLPFSGSLVQTLTFTVTCNVS